MALLDLQGMETTRHNGGGFNSWASLLLCGHSSMSLALCA
ncbi:MAG: SapB/AmfS family lanthipeptide [Actinocatenispora sp.]